MRYWVMYNVLLVSWSLYLLAIHISQKDHWTFQVILFVLWFMLFMRLLRKYSFTFSEACVHLCISFSIVYGGHLVFNASIL